MSRKRREEVLGLPDEVEIELVELGSERLAVLTLPGRAVDAPGVSPVESDVLRRIVGGESNAHIARERGVSERTIANQVASLLRKYDVASRYELVAATHRRRDT